MRVDGNAQKNGAKVQFAKRKARAVARRSLAEIFRLAAFSSQVRTIERMLAMTWVARSDDTRKKGATDRTSPKSCELSYSEIANFKPFP